MRVRANQGVRDCGARGVVVVVVIREHAHETSTDTKASVLPVGEVVVTAGATLHGATHTTSSDSDMVASNFTARDWMEPMRFFDAAKNATAFRWRVVRRGLHGPTAAPSSLVTQVVLVGTTAHAALMARG